MPDSVPNRERDRSGNAAVCPGGGHRAGKDKQKKALERIARPCRSSAEAGIRTALPNIPGPPAWGSCIEAVDTCLSN